jgi:asparagine synthase (glutamine-hydrolysing)
MCGITGFVDSSGTFGPDALERVVASMNGTLAHRGPDGSGTWVSPNEGVAFGHRRLSIVDLSDRASQPALAGETALVFNGELYNFRAIAAELGITAQGDTEVMLHAFRRWGCREATSRFAGMFAFAYFDRAAGEMWLGRDRFGEKPLYYVEKHGRFAFASELKALRNFPGLAWDIDPDAVENFLRFGFVPGPGTIYSGVSKLAPGHLLHVKLGKNLAIESKPYWSLGEVANRNLAEEPAGDYVERGRDLLRKLVTQYAQADVPVGTFLSGGIDSSLVTAILKENVPGTVRTFTIGFQDGGFDEAPAARAVAKHLGTEHHEAYVGATEALSVIGKLPQIYDEPFADSSQIPTFLVSQLAQGHVKVALSGDGGDELFAGYNRHFLGATAWRHLSRMPASIRAGLAGAIGSVPAGLREAAFRGAYRMSGRAAPQQAADKIQKLLSCLGAATLEDLYLDLVSIEKNPGQFLTTNKRAPGQKLLSAVDSRDPLFVMQYLDSVFYLPNDILTKVDRASMSAGLEVRCPFLDHRLTEFAWGLPHEQRVRGTTGKVLLREILASYVPPALWDRPKAGFAIPIESWLRGPLREWAEAELNSGVLIARNVLDEPAVRALWNNFLAGSGTEKYTLWNVLVLSQWLRTSV